MKMKINISGFDTTLQPITPDRLKGLPVDIFVRYKFFEGEFNGVSLCFLAGKDGSQHSTPVRCRKTSIKINQILQLPVVFLFENLSYVIRQRMIEQGVYFVISGKYANLPNLFVNARDTQEQVKLSGKLSPVAQYILLYYLQHENCIFNNFEAIRQKTVFSYLQITRAIVDLERFGLCETKTVQGKGKSITFSENKKSLWQSSQKFLRSPILKVMFTDNPIPENIGRIAGVNALAYYTELNSIRQRILAVDKTSFSEIETDGIALNQVEGNTAIQVWKYPPTIMSDSKVVDALSLWLTMDRDKNPRVEDAIEQLINNIKW